MDKARMQQVHDHFNDEAQVFDSNILKSVPYYIEMLEALTSMLPFKKNQKVNVADIGTGTGNVALAVKRACPNANILCIDLSQNMLDIAKEKLKGFKGVKYVRADIASYAFPYKFDAIISSLTLHHLETDKDKHTLHKKAYAALNKGGIFINADIIIAPNKKMQEIYINKWKNFLLKSSTPSFTADRHEKYLAEDRPAILLNEIKSLQKAGFKNIEVFWKYYNFAVYGGNK